MTKLKNFKQFVDDNPELGAALKVMQAIESRGHEVVIAGGAVRDMLLGNDPYDIDIASNMSSEAVAQLFRAHDIGQSRDFGTMCVVQDGFTFEVTEFRADGEYSDCRRPDSVCFVDSFEEDAKRRDLTINALGLDCRGNVIDHVDGVKDLESGIIRTVGDPYERFAEDLLRPIRAIRFAARYDFGFDQGTAEAIYEHAKDACTKVAPERVKAELFKMAKEGASLGKSVLLMDELGMLEHMLPEIRALKGMPHSDKYHPEGDCFEHTVAACMASSADAPLWNVAVLFHDVGKAVTYKNRDGRHTYYGHDFEGGKIIVEQIAPRLKLSKDERNSMAYAAQMHMRFHCIEEMKPHKVVRLLESRHWPVLKHVSFCDDSCRGAAFDPAAWERKEEVISRVKSRIMRGTEVDDLIKAFNGDRVIAETNRKPGPWMKKAMSTVRGAIYDGSVTNEFEAVRLCRSFRKK